MLSLLLEVLIKSRELTTAKGSWGYFEKWDSWSKQFPEVSTIPAEKFFYDKVFSQIRDREPCNSELVNYVLEGLIIFCHSPKKKKTFTLQLLHI